eukprot:CAMPEP_0202980244 /NCGR_PEP_ID=MMETSP1396-20130829/86199_1 /ASSEMBLY_ACC=CAM_ASM_000872 /TAXON_ID= /ORGANISM="Pseudokeronopsis sp., Strain Brazil" /LENGTH=101 /DNA_ID=CAMNT_0049720085 /DNA_START=1219 /DNA_END=1525 /DNA_ORIENTATION=+
MNNALRGQLEEDKEEKPNKPQDSGAIASKALHKKNPSRVYALKKESTFMTPVHRRTLAGYQKQTSLGCNLGARGNKESSERTSDFNLGVTGNRIASNSNYY